MTQGIHDYSKFDKDKFFAKLLAPDREPEQEPQNVVPAEPDDTDSALQRQPNLPFFDVAANDDGEAHLDFEKIFASSGKPAFFPSADDCDNGVNEGNIPPYPPVGITPVAQGGTDGEEEEVAEPQLLGAFTSLREMYEEGLFLEGPKTRLGVGMLKDIYGDYRNPKEILKFKGGEHIFTARPKSPYENPENNYYVIYFECFWKIEGKSQKAELTMIFPNEKQYKKWRDMLFEPEFKAGKQKFRPKYKSVVIAGNWKKLFLYG